MLPRSTNGDPSFAVRKKASIMVGSEPPATQPAQDHMQVPSGTRIVNQVPSNVIQHTTSTSTYALAGRDKYMPASTSTAAVRSVPCARKPSASDVTSTMPMCTGISAPNVRPKEVPRSMPIDKLRVNAGVVRRPRQSTNAPCPSSRPSPHPQQPAARPTTLSARQRAPAIPTTPVASACALAALSKAAGATAAVTPTHVAATVRALHVLAPLLRVRVRQQQQAGSAQEPVRQVFSASNARAVATLLAKLRVQRDKKDITQQPCTQPKLHEPHPPRRHSRAVYRRPGGEPFPPGTVLCERFSLVARLGSGAFGDVYLARDAVDGRMIAVKLEPATGAAQRGAVLRGEHEALRALQGVWAVAPLRAYLPDASVGANVLAQGLLGCSLAHMRKQLSSARASPFAVVCVLVQSLSALSAVHARGLLHRDIKPANVCLGLTRDTLPCEDSAVAKALKASLAATGIDSAALPSPGSAAGAELVAALIDRRAARRLHLVDWGLVREYADVTGVLVPERRGLAGFRGTPKYASPYVHAGHEQCPRDDLYSVLYMGLELATGSLPWAHLPNKDVMGCMKRSMPGAEVLKPLFTMAMLDDQLLRLADRAAQGEDVAEEEERVRAQLAQMPHGRRMHPVDYLRGREHRILPQVGLFAVSEVPEPRSGLWVVFCLLRALIRYAEALTYEDVPDYPSLITLCGWAFALLRQPLHAPLDWESRLGDYTARRPRGPSRVLSPSPSDVHAPSLREPTVVAVAADGAHVALRLRLSAQRARLEQQAHEDTQRPHAPVDFARLRYLATAFPEVATVSLPPHPEPAPEASQRQARLHAGIAQHLCHHDPLFLSRAASSTDARKLAAKCAALRRELAGMHRLAKAEARDAIRIATECEEQARAASVRAAAQVEALMAAVAKEEPALRQGLLESGDTDEARPSLFTEPLSALPPDEAERESVRLAWCLWTRDPDPALLQAAYAGLTPPDTPALNKSGELRALGIRMRQLRFFARLCRHDLDPAKPRHKLDHLLEQRLQRFTARALQATDRALLVHHRSSRARVVADVWVTTVRMITRQARAAQTAEAMWLQRAAPPRHPHESPHAHTHTPAPTRTPSPASAPTAAPALSPRPLALAPPVPASPVAAASSPPRAALPEPHAGNASMKAHTHEHAGTADLTPCVLPAIAAADNSSANRPPSQDVKEAVDAADAVDAVDAVAVMDAVDAVNAVDTVVVMDAVDAVNAVDTVVVMDAVDAVNAVNAVVVMDAVDAMDAMETADSDDAHVSALSVASAHEPSPSGASAAYVWERDAPAPTIELFDVAESPPKPGSVGCATARAPSPHSALVTSTTCTGDTGACAVVGVDGTARLPGPLSVECIEPPLSTPLTPSRQPAPSSTSSATSAGGSSPSHPGAHARTPRHDGVTATSIPSVPLAPASPVCAPRPPSVPSGDAAPLPRPCLSPKTPVHAPHTPPSPPLTPSTPPAPHAPPLSPRVPPVTPHAPLLDTPSQAARSGTGSLLRRRTLRPAQTTHPAERLPHPPPQPSPFSTPARALRAHAHTHVHTPARASSSVPSGSAPALNRAPSGPAPASPRVVYQWPFQSSSTSSSTSSSASSCSPSPRAPSHAPSPSLPSHRSASRRPRSRTGHLQGSPTRALAWTTAPSSPSSSSSSCSSSCSTSAGPRGPSAISTALSAPAFGGASSAPVLCGASARLLPSGAHLPFGGNLYLAQRAFAPPQPPVSAVHTPSRNLALIYTRPHSPAAPAPVPAPAPSAAEVAVGVELCEHATQYSTQHSSARPLLPARVQSADAHVAPTTIALAAAEHHGLRAVPTLPPRSASPASHAAPNCAARMQRTLPKPHALAPALPPPPTPTRPTQPPRPVQSVRAALRTRHVSPPPPGLVPLSSLCRNPYQAQPLWGPHQCPDHNSHHTTLPESAHMPLHPRASPLSLPSRVPSRGLSAEAPPRSVANAAGPIRQSFAPGLSHSHETRQGTQDAATVAPPVPPRPRTHTLAHMPPGQT